MEDIEIARSAKLKNIREKRTGIRKRTGISKT